MLSGTDTETVVRSVDTVLGLKARWQAPPKYLVPHVSDAVLKIILGYKH